MHTLLRLSAAIDRLLTAIARFGAWAAILLMLVVCYDVGSRYFGVPKPFGLNSTKVQESQYWLHTALFALVIAYGYLRQAHIRIDLVRSRLPRKVQFVVEMVGCLAFLIPASIIVGWLALNYTLASYQSGEVSKSVIGLSHIWILKGFMPVMYGLMALAGVSQFIKSLAGFLDRLPLQQQAETLGGDH